MSRTAPPLRAASASPRHARHVPEHTRLYGLVRDHAPALHARLSDEGRILPMHVREEFDAYLRCGVLERGFVRVVCEHCHAERLVAFSCKRRGFCPSCGARRMAESARHLVEEVFGPCPVRQWVLSFPYPLRSLFASKPEAIGPADGAGVAAKLSGDGDIGESCTQQGGDLVAFFLGQVSIGHGSFAWSWSGPAYGTWPASVQGNCTSGLNPPSAPLLDAECRQSRIGVASIRTVSSPMACEWRP